MNIKLNSFCIFGLPLKRSHQKVLVVLPLNNRVFVFIAKLHPYLNVLIRGIKVFLTENFVRLH